jgi:hypothetical protein
MAVNIPKPFEPFKAGLEAELEAYCVLGAGAILPIIQVLINGIAFMIGHMEPEQARNVVIASIREQLKPLVEMEFDKTRTQKGILIPSGSEKAKLG